MKIRLLTVFLLFLLTVPCWPAETEPRVIRDLIILGLKNNLGLQVERINLPLSEEQIKVEAAVFDSELFAVAEYAETSTPQSISSSLGSSFETDQLSGEIGLRKRYESGLSAVLSLNSERTTDNNQLEELAPRYRAALLLDLSQPLLRNSGTAVNTTQLQLSRIQNQQLRYSFFLQAQTLALQVETLALQFVSDAEVVKLRQQAVQLAQELYAANNRRFAAGVIAVSEVQEAEADLANRELNLSLAMQAQELSLEQLNRQLDYSLPVNFSAAAVSSVSVAATMRIEPNLPEFDQLFATAKHQRFDLKISSLEIESSTLQKSYFNNQQQPQLDLKLQAGLNGLAGEELNSSSSSAYAGRWGHSFNSLSAADGYQWRVGLEFSLPLGNQAAKARFRQAALRERQATFRKRDMEAALKQELLQQRTVVQRAAEQFGIAGRFQNLAEKSFQQEHRRLEEGLSDTFRIIRFQNNMINAKIERIIALTKYHRAVAKMNFSRGIILQQHGITVLAGAEEANLETM
jgi:outer membrane protein TolC